MARNRQRAKERKRRAQEQQPQPDRAASAVPGVLPDAPAVTTEELDESRPGDAALLQAEQDAAAEHPESVPPEAEEQPARQRGGPRFLQFLKACAAELQRVQWPDRTQVAQATAVVLGFVVVAGAYLGIADEAAQRLVDLIL